MVGLLYPQRKIRRRGSRLAETQKPLDLVVDPKAFNLIADKVVATRKYLSDGRTCTYDEVQYKWGDKHIKVQGRHFPIESVFSCANRKCSACYGKGYQFSEVSKKKFPDPSMFILAEEDCPKDGSAIERKVWEEDQKKKTTWRVLQVCGCAVKGTNRRHPEALSNQLHNVWMTLDYQIEDAS